ncbi:uncharacterized protein NPIL_47651 [Nephila pilipes]|uniref:Uncharacterized protein n=1 Tax=Nephila pilipes TaxID=299642 RepID=A0A8X6PES7_NEPPI|nr:uncharacterized protein NPIL_47651 [Nephila pilipes]
MNSVTYLPEGLALSIKTESEVCEETEISTTEYSVLILFYETLLDDLSKEYSVTPNNISDSIKNIVQSYRNVKRGQLQKYIDYNDIRNCLGYLHRYATCHTALVWVTLTNVFNSCLSSVLTSELSKNNLNVMFLGGGPGNDFFGFLNALYGKHESLINLYVTVVDRMTGWNDVFLKTVEKLKLGDYGPASKIFEDVCVIPSFIDFDLKMPVGLNYSLKMKLQSANIVFLVKFLSHISDNDKLIVVKNIVEYMGTGAILIFIDCPYLSSVFSAVSELKLVYHADEKQFIFNSTKNRFGYAVNNKCRASTYIFTKLATF